jgi:hypothetical protein
MSKKVILLLLIMLPFKLAAQIPLSSFASRIAVLEAEFNDSKSNDYRLSAAAKKLGHELAEIYEVEAPQRSYYLESSWISRVISAVAVETSVKKRQLIYTNLIDTLNGLLADIRARVPTDGVSKEKMLAALERAMRHTSEVRVARGVPVGEAMEWTGRGSFVVQQSGEAVSLVSAEAVRNSNSRSKYSGSYSGSGSFSGSGSGSYSGSASSQSSTQQSQNSTSLSGQSYASNQSQTSKSAKSGQNAGSSVKQSRQTLPRKTVTQKKKAIKPEPPKPPKPPKPEKKPKEPLKFADYIFWLIMGLCVVGFLVMLYFMFRNMRRKVWHEQQELIKAETSLPAERLKTETIYEKAIKAAAAGNFSEGIRLLTIGALLMLEEKRVMNFRDTLTNGEYLRELLQERQLYGIFKEPMGLFDRLIYGFKAPKQPDFEKFKEFYLELERLQK